MTVNVDHIVYEATKITGRSLLPEVAKAYIRRTTTILNHGGAMEIGGAALPCPPLRTRRNVAEAAFRVHGRASAPKWENKATGFYRANDLSEDSFGLSNLIADHHNLGGTVRNAVIWIRESDYLLGGLFFFHEGGEGLRPVYESAEVDDGVERFAFDFGTPSQERVLDGVKILGFRASDAFADFVGDDLGTNIYLRRLLDSGQNSHRRELPSPMVQLIEVVSDKGQDYRFVEPKRFAERVRRREWSAIPDNIDGEGDYLVAGCEALYSHDSQGSVFLFSVAPDVATIRYYHALGDATDEGADNFVADEMPEIYVMGCMAQFAMENHDQELKNQNWVAMVGQAKQLNASLDPKLLRSAAPIRVGFRAPGG